MSKKAMVIISVVAVVVIAILGICAVKRLQDSALRPL